MATGPRILVLQQAPTVRASDFVTTPSSSPFSAALSQGFSQFEVRQEREREAAADEQLKEARALDIEGKKLQLEESKNKITEEQKKIKIQERQDKLLESIPGGAQALLGTQDVPSDFIGPLSPQQQVLEAAPEADQAFFTNPTVQQFLAKAFTTEEAGEAAREQEEKLALIEKEEKLKQKLEQERPKTDLEKAQLKIAQNRVQRGDLEVELFDLKLDEAEADAKPFSSKDIEVADVNGVKVLINKKNGTLKEIRPSSQTGLPAGIIKAGSQLFRLEGEPGKEKLVELPIQGVPKDIDENQLVEKIDPAGNKTGVFMDPITEKLFVKNKEGDFRMIPTTADERKAAAQELRAQNDALLLGAVPNFGGGTPGTPGTAPVTPNIDDLTADDLDPEDFSDLF